MTIPALIEDGKTFHVLDQRSSAAGPRITFMSQTEGGQKHRNLVACTFGTGTGRARLTAVKLDGRSLSEPELFMLDRFWLGSGEALAQDPDPLDDAAVGLRLPAGTGYAVQQIVNAIPSAAVYGLLAAAYSLIYGLVGRINLAFGAFAALGGSAALLVMIAGPGWPSLLTLAVAATVALVCAGLHGAVAGRLVFRSLHGVSGQQSLVATVGLALFLSEYTRLAQGPTTRWASPLLDAPLAIARDPGFTVTITPIAILVSAVAITTALIVLWVMRSTQFGRDWRAFSDDPLAAGLFGISRNRLFAITFALACALAGLSGGIEVVFFGELGGSYATTLGIKALTAAVLGGIGSVPGAFLGGCAIGLVESGWSAAFPVVHRDLVVFAMLVTCLIWRPGGFLGDRDLAPRRV